MASAEGGVSAPRLAEEGTAIPFPDASFREGFVGEWRRARRRALPYESNAHSYRLTAARLTQSKINAHPYCGGFLTAIGTQVADL
jgi:hypothetical protein